MPTYRNITVTIHTPFAVEGLPEIAPFTPIPGPNQTQLVDKSKRRVSVFVPVPHQSLFWLSYSIEAPPQDDTFFVFKLFVNRQEVATWCCDKEENWRGKIMFGLFDTGKDDLVVGGAGMEKRIFKFGQPGEEDWRVVGDLSTDGDENKHVEVKVCRSNMKMRVPRKMATYNGLPGDGLELIPAGLTQRGAAHTFYKFGLIDPQDRPYATFRFYYRSWGEQELGLRSLSSEADTSEEDLDLLALRMEQVELSEDESVFADITPIATKGTKETASTPISKSSGPTFETPAMDRDSIPAQCFNSCPISPATEQEVPTSSPWETQNEEGVGLKQCKRLDPSPERGRSRRINQIPVAAQSAIYQQMAIPVRYGNSNGPWRPPTPRGPPSPIPKLPPPPPPPPPLPLPHTSEALDYPPFQYAPALPRPDDPDLQPCGNIKRLSIPPSLVLRPFMERGPLPPSPSKADPSKADLEAEHGLAYYSASIEEIPSRRAVKTGGVLRTVMANALKRRMTDTTIEK